MTVCRIYLGGGGGGGGVGSTISQNCHIFDNVCHDKETFLLSITVSDS